MFTVGQLKDKISGLLSGLNLNNVIDLNGAIERAARVLSQKADIPEASGKESITLYDGVYDYIAPSTIFGSTLNDLRIQGASRSSLDYVYKLPIAQFDRTKGTLPNGYKVAFEYRQGTGIMRVAQAIARGKLTFDAMSATTGWTIAGSAASLVADETVYYQTPASLRFTLSGASSGYIEKTLTSTLDGTDYKKVGVIFVAIRTPSASDLTSLAVRIGSSSSAYTTVSATTGFLGAWIANDWLLVALDLSTGTDTGTPDYSKLAYARITVTHGATLTNFRLGSIWISLPSPHEILFQSNAIFMVLGSNPSVTITNDNDLIILNANAFTLFEHECALGIAFQQGGGLASSLIQKLEKILYGIPNSKTDLGLYALYRGDNPSQELREVGNYYDDTW